MFIIIAFQNLNPDTLQAQFHSWIIVGIIVSDFHKILNLFWLLRVIQTLACWFYVAHPLQRLSLLDFVNQTQHEVVNDFNDT